MTQNHPASELNQNPANAVNETNGVNGTNGDAVSKNTAKKEAAAVAARAQSADSEDVLLAGKYGDLPLVELQSKKVPDVTDWTEVGDVTEAMKDRKVLIRGRAQTIRAFGKNMVFILVREKGYTVQCVVTVKPEIVSRQMVKYVAVLSRESIMDIEGVVSVPESAIISATQQVEVQVRKLYCVSRAAVLPINVEDCARSEAEIEKAKQAGEKMVSVHQDTRLNYRVLDLRTPANQGIFRIQSRVGTIFREFLMSQGFSEIHSPKLIGGSSEGGASVFKLLDYKGQPACLAQSLQLHKQMSICGDFGRIFEIGPVFRAEDSNTHRHLCEFTGLDVEMEIKLL